MNNYILPLDGKPEVELVGGKALNLSGISSLKLNLPSGFIISTLAFRLFIQHHSLGEKITSILKEYSEENENSIHVNSKIRDLFETCEVPDEIKNEISNACEKLMEKHPNLSLAVRSSATDEDSSTRSFAGQYVSYLNIIGIENLMKAIKMCWASVFSSTLSYHDKNNMEFPEMAVLVQEMIDGYCSGVLFTRNPITKDKGSIIIESTFGLGEDLVKGKISPDMFIVTKKNGSVTERTINLKKNLIRCSSKSGQLIEEKVSEDLQLKSSLSDDDIVNLTKIGIIIEDFFKHPQDIEWTISRGNERRIFILQSRNITT